MDNALELKPNLHIIQGYLYGLKNSSLLVTINLKNNSIPESIFDDILSSLNSINLATDPTNLIEIKNGAGLDKFSYTFLECIYLIQKASYWPIFNRGFLIKDAKENNTYQFAIPTLKNSYRAVSSLIVKLVNFFNAFIKKEDIDKYQTQLKNLIIQFKKLNPKSTNIPHLLYTADKLEIPFRQIQDTLYQYGYGRESRWLDSTFTDETPLISSKIARNKNLASLILREAGFPVAKQRVIKNTSEALSFAKQFGFPVVIKPYNLDGGVGVFTGLKSEQEIINAFQKALKFSKKIIIETHIPGRDYRLVVFNGILIWAIERIPACVIGNGKNSVKELIDIENNNPHRGDSDNQPLKYLSLDEEALGLIKTIGYDENSIPANQEQVFLRLHANISSGGMPIGVFDKVHEDNKTLAIKAAELLRLDLSGIDLIMPDISKSWKKIGAAICEINAQPMLGSLTSFHLYEKILKEMLPKNGRVPIILLLGKDKNGLMEKLNNTFENKNIFLKKIGSSSLNEKEFVVNIYNQILSALNDRETAGLIINITDDSILRSGIPCQYIDALILCGPCEDLQEENKIQTTIDKLLEALMPMCQNDLIIVGPESDTASIIINSKNTPYTSADEVVEKTTKELFSFYSL